MINVMKSKYVCALGSQNALLRPLGTSDFDFFGSSAVWGPDTLKPTHPNGSQHIITVDADLNAFFRWFDGILECICCVKQLWTRRAVAASASAYSEFVLHGFISRDSAATMLSDNLCGCFIVGFSQSEPCFVINVVAKNKTKKPVKVYVDSKNALPFKVSFDKNVCSFETLESLIRSSSELTVSYPNLNKVVIY